MASYLHLREAFWHLASSKDAFFASQKHPAEDAKDAERCRKMPILSLGQFSGILGMPPKRPNGDILEASEAEHQHLGSILGLASGILEASEAEHQAS